VQKFVKIGVASEGFVWYNKCVKFETYQEWLRDWLDDARQPILWTRC